MLLSVLTMLACGSSDTLEDSGDGEGSLFDDTTESDGLTVEIETSAGTIVVVLEPELTPETTENFLEYASSGFYDGVDGGGATIFHRVIDGFMIQGGGYTTGGALKETLAPITLETDVGLSNERGTIAMARTNQPDSATSQFFINLVDNAFLDYESASNPGYAVFGVVTEGMDVVDAIGSVATSNDQPVETIEIVGVSVY